VIFLLKKIKMETMKIAARELALTLGCSHTSVQLQNPALCPNGKNETLQP